jgi:hypothetical protein
VCAHVEVIEIPDGQHGFDALPPVPGAREAVHAAINTKRPATAPIPRLSRGYRMLLSRQGQSASGRGDTPGTEGHWGIGANAQIAC